MEETRESLTEKLETLEDRLLNSVHDASSAVRDAMDTVKETMHEGAETVKEAVDVPGHVRRQPWLMFGGAVLAGYLVGSWLGRDSEGRRPREPTPTPAPAPKRQATGNGHHNKPTPKPEPAAKSPSLLDAVEPEIRHLKGLALGVTLGTVREMIAKQVPPHLADELRGIIDGVTRKVGGEPIPPGDVPFTEPSESSSFCAEQPRW